MRAMSHCLPASLAIVAATHQDVQVLRGGLDILRHIPGKCRNLQENHTYQQTRIYGMFLPRCKKPLFADSIPIRHPDASEGSHLVLGPDFLALLLLNLVTVPGSARPQPPYLNFKRPGNYEREFLLIAIYLCSIISRLWNHRRPCRRLK